jgi:hypothetical protein
MSTPKIPPPEPLEESVAGEEDPGASLDLPATKPLAPVPGKPAGADAIAREPDLPASDGDKNPRGG